MTEECTKQLDSLRDILMGQIKKVTAKNDISPTELDNMTKALCAIETIERIEAGNFDQGYSNDTYRFSGTMPRVSHDRRYDHHMGYSRHSIADRMVDALERMYDDAGTEHERKLIDKYIRMLRDE